MAAAPDLAASVAFHARRAEKAEAELIEAHDRARDAETERAAAEAALTAVWQAITDDDLPRLPSGDGTVVDAEAVGRRVAALVSQRDTANADFVVAADGGKHLARQVDHLEGVLSSLVRGVLDAIGARDRAVPLLPLATLAEWLATETRLVVDDLAMARDNHHARATKAEAEVARLTAALTAQTARADGAEAEALRVTRERDALRAIVDGRTTPPTDAEIEAHAEVGGEWVVREYTIAGMFSAFSLDGCVSAKRHASVPSSGRRWRRWWPVDRGGIPCAWPTVAKVTP